MNFSKNILKFKSLDAVSDLSVPSMVVGCETNINVDDEYFKKIFDNYLDEFIKPIMSHSYDDGFVVDDDDERYYEIKPLLNLLLLFLKEEILVDNCLRNYAEFNKFAFSGLAHKNRFFVNLRPHICAIHTWALDIESASEYIKPFVDNYRLDKSVATVDFKRIISKI